METEQLHPISCTNLYQNKQQTFHHGTLCASGEDKKYPQKFLQNSSYGYWSIPSFLQYIKQENESLWEP